MDAVRQALIDKIWSGLEPFDKDAFSPELVDFQGWASDNPLLRRSIDEVQPKIIVEIGVWKGGSVITMAEHMRALQIDGAVIAVDTWLGASEHWLEPSYRPSLRLSSGYPTLYKTFSSNIMAKHLQDLVLPLPLDSLNAAQVLKHYRVNPDIVHVDGGHDYHSVMSDLRVWWPMISEGGILLGDDYHPLGIDVWPEVRAAFHDFFNTSALENFGGKCIVRKPSASVHKLS